jgi:hypothetical protein
MSVKVTTKPAPVGDEELRYRPDPVRSLGGDVDNPNTMGTYKEVALGALLPCGGGLGWGETLAAKSTPTLSSLIEGEGKKRQYP